MYIVRIKCRGFLSRGRNKQNLWKCIQISSLAFSIRWLAQRVVSDLFQFYKPWLSEVSYQHGCSERFEGGNSRKESEYYRQMTSHLNPKREAILDVIVVEIH